MTNLGEHKIIKENFKIDTLKLYHNSVKSDKMSLTVKYETSLIYNYDFLGSLHTENNQDMF